MGFSRWMVLALGVGLLPVGAAAQPAPAAPTAPAPPGPMARARYSLPWVMRPAIAPTLLRVDVAVAMQSQATNTASIFTGGLRPIRSRQDLGFYGRVGVLTHAPDTGAQAGETGAALANPVLFALWTPQLAPGWRLPVFLGATVPVGAGADASPLRRATIGTGIQTRQAMDNAMFAANYFTVMGGAGLMWMGHGITAQAEFTVLQLTRVMGESVDVDKARTNFTLGAHVGYQVIPQLTLSLEAHYQRWLTTPAAVAANSVLRDQMTIGLGARANLPVGTALVRPGVAFFLPVGGRMGELDYRIVQFDLAVPL